MKTFITNLYLLLPFLLFLPAFSQVETIQVKVVGIVDGDTVTVLTKAKTQKQVRIKGIDAPEKTQAFGIESREKLNNLIFDKNVVIEYSKIKDDGEILGKVFLKNKDVGLEMLRNGFAWCNDGQGNSPNEKDDNTYCLAEEEARRQLIGLWKNPTAQPPWEFKKTYISQALPRRASFKSNTKFEGRVTEIIDGASIAVIMPDNSRLAVCISRLETPEPGQPKADIAEQHLKDLLLQKNVRVDISGFPEDENCVSADVYLDDINVNLQMVRDGVAWANKNYRYPEGYYSYEQAEQSARRENRGIWTDAAPMAPWEYREQMHQTEQEGNDGLNSVYGYGGSASGGGGNGTVRVRGYYRSNGNYVRSHTRSAPGSGGSRSRSSGSRRR